MDEAGYLRFVNHTQVAVVLRGLHTDDPSATGVAAPRNVWRYREGGDTTLGPRDKGRPVYRPTDLSPKGRSREMVDRPDARDCHLRVRDVVRLDSPQTSLVWGVGARTHPRTDEVNKFQPGSEVLEDRGQLPFGGDGSHSSTP